MPVVIINDLEVEAKVGERLLSVARRNAAHIGFVCDGNGICQTCQCRVLAGAEHLSPPSEAERIWMPERRLADGHRLACQTALRGRGPVAILTTVEELRRQSLALLSPPAGEDWVDQLEPLLDNLVRRNVDQLTGFPFNVLATIARVGVRHFLFPWRDIGAWASDGARVTNATFAGNGRAGATGARADAQAGRRQLPLTPEDRVIEAARALRRVR